MKIRNEIVLINVFHVIFLVLVGGFAIQDLNLVLTKLRFAEIADDLNASFLEMRIAEKNYFLYHDDSALSEIDEKIAFTLQVIDKVSPDIVRAIGVENLERLKDHVSRYSKVVQRARQAGGPDAVLRRHLRQVGKELREFSATTTQLERQEVNRIIAGSKRVLLLSFLAILVAAILVGQLLSNKILRSLGKIEDLARVVSRGDFHGSDGPVPTDEFGTVISAINTMSDELRDREEELIQSKKLASLGVLTAGVAHELTNPLNNISMIAQNFMELHDYLSPENQVDLMSKVQGETERIEAVVRNLLDFSKPKDANLRKTDINQTVRRALRLMQNSIDIANVETRLDLAEVLPSVFIDENQFVQVLVNFILNATQAMKPGGILGLTTQLTPAADAIQVAVADTGKGIPPEFLPHIFDPFFSTKGVGGTGLGLSVSYSIIKNHGGNIKVESVVDKGTRFTIDLPLYKGDELNGKPLSNHGHR